MRRLVLWAPLALFLVFVAVVAVQLYSPDDRVHRSQLIGKPFPAVSLPAGASGVPTFAPAPGARLVNIFASWCVPCIAEAPVLAEMRVRGAPIDGIAIRDKRADVDRFLARHGNPYRSIGLDADGRVQISIGSSGVPETFVVDARGIIRHQHIGPVLPQHMDELMTRLREAG